MTKEKIERLENENRALTEQIKDLTKKLETANHFSKAE